MLLYSCILDKEGILIMNKKYLEKLEFYKICNILSEFSITYVAKSLSLKLLPISNKKDLQKSLKQTTEASNLIYRKGNAPISEIAEISNHIKKLESYSFLSAKQLLDLANILKISRCLKDYFFSKEIDMSEFCNLEPLFTNLYTNTNIENTIFKSIIDENTFSDDASKTLYTIRKNIKNKESEIKSKLNSFLHSKYIQESVITVRNNRFVIPVKNEYRQEIKGFIHDISSSGSTVFIEPITIFDLNNDLNNLKNEENIEIEKILQSLSSLFFEIIENIKNNINLIGIIDFIFAKGKYSNSINASEPIITEEKIINLIDAWHPLLDINKAVKNTISIGKNYNSLIITGPNTGGKTVTLKTAGLLCLMALSGLHIPAKEKSSIYFFDNIFADIGDEQSISASLSTFSSHMSNISNILENSTSDSFILLDELGSGTDPQEGASLAISILEQLNKNNCLTLATTHYSELKQYALVTNGFMNASVEFNIDTLSPTYKLLIGVPGTSNAFAISQKLGIPENILNRAKTLLYDDEIHIEELLTSIYQDKKIIEEEKIEIQKNYEVSKNLKESLENKLSTLTSSQKSIIDEAKEKARDILLSAKEDANTLIKEIEKSKNSKDANNIRNSLNEKINNLTVQKHENKETIIHLSDLKPGIQVYIPSLNQIGTIISASRENHIQVQLNLGKMFFKITELELSKSTTKNISKVDYSKKADFKPKSISSEINVLGQNVDEACFLIDKYLDNCYLAGLTSTRIVHGKGTGALREGIHKFLKTHPHVKSFRIGTFGEGEMGVTIVELK